MGEGAPDRFHVVARLGDGRRASVLLAEDRQLGRTVALKVLRDPTDDVAKRLMVREALALGRVDHPNVVQLLDHGVDTDLGPFIATPYADGRTLGAILDEHPRPPADWAREVLIQLLAALQAVHLRGGVHGDVTPANCLCVGFASFAAPPDLRLLDFGASRWRSDPVYDEPGIGTPTYLSPEQAQLGEPTPASDLYSVGIIAYEMAVGVPPFRASTSTEIIWQHLHEPIRRPSEAAPEARISTSLERAILRALQKTPADRFSSAAALAEALSPSASTTPVAPADARILVGDRGEHDLASTLLARVREYWIEGALGRTTDGVILVRQALVRADDAAQPPGPSSEPEPAAGFGASIADAFERGQALLILGEPGYGKTVNLLRLARLLADRSVGADGSVRSIPVVFTLSSWDASSTDLVEWMCRELGLAYQVPHRAARRLFAESRVIPLLDGLDDLSLSERTRCIGAINDYCRVANGHGLRPKRSLVLTCRTHEYRELGVPLEGASAFILRPLDPRDIKRQLRGPAQRALLTALDTDPVLEDLARTPVLLHVMRVGFRDSHSFRAALTTQADATRELFETFLSATLDEQPPRIAANVRTTLERVARLMTRTGRTLLLIEDAQPTWLATSRQRLAYALLSRGVVVFLFCASIVPAVGLSPLGNQGFRTSLSFAAQLAAIGAVVLTLGFGLRAAFRLHRAPASEARRTRPRPLAAVAGGLAIGALSGAVLGAFVRTLHPHPTAFIMSLELGLGGGAILSLSRRKHDGVQRDIATVESMGWSWRNIEPRKGVALGAVSLALFLAASMLETLSAAAFGALAVVVMGVGVLGHRARELHSRAAPNVGIHRTLRNAATAAAVAFASVTLLFGTRYDLGYSAWVGLSAGVVVGLWLGGIDVVNHYVLRLVLHWGGIIRFGVARDLEPAAHLGFVRRIGNGYMFMHAMLQKHIAEGRRS